MPTVRYGKGYSERMSLIDAIYNTAVVRYSALEQQVEKQHKRCGSERRRCDVVLGVLLVELVVRWFAEHSRAAWWVRPRNSMYYPSMSDTWLTLALVLPKRAFVGGHWRPVRHGREAAWISGHDAFFGHGPIARYAFLWLVKSPQSRGFAKV